MTLDVDATLITSHSEKEKAAGNYKGGYGFHPLQVYLDETREALGGLLRPGNAGSNTAADHMTVFDLALAQIPAEYVESSGDPGARGHGRRDARAGRLLPRGTDAVLGRLRADRAGPRRDPRNPRGCLGPGARPGRHERENGEVCEITDMVDLSAWPEGSRLIVRRERPHPGAQLSFTDHDGYRFQAILTDQPDEDIAVLECRHRQHAHVEDRIRDDKDTGLAKFPFKEFALNEVWLEIVDARARPDRLDPSARCSTGELAKAEPKRLRYRLLHVAGRLAFSGRRAKLHLQHTWPWAAELLAAFQKLKTLPARERLTAATATHHHPSSTSGHGRDHRCPKTGEHSHHSQERVTDYAATPNHQSTSHHRQTATHSHPTRYRTFRASPERAVRTAPPG